PARARSAPRAGDPAGAGSRRRAAPPWGPPPTAAPPTLAPPTAPPQAAPPQAANGGATGTTMPPDLRFTIPRDTAARTWRSSTKPRHAPRPGGGVHHDDGPPLARGPPLPAPTRPHPQRARRSGFVRGVRAGAGGGGAAPAAPPPPPPPYAARLPAPLAPPVAKVSATPAASTGTTSPAPSVTSAQPGWTAPIPV